MADHARNGFDFVLIARRTTITRPFAVLQDELETALKQVGAWRDGDAGTAQPDPGN